MRESYGQTVAMRGDRDRYQYGYDRNSNRLYRKNELASTFGELYHVNNAAANSEYDGLDRLKEFRRGTLDDPPAEGLLAGSTRFCQDRALDPPAYQGLSMFRAKPMFL